MLQRAVASGDCDHDILMKFLLLGDAGHGLHFSMAKSACSVGGLQVLENHLCSCALQMASLFTTTFAPWPSKTENNSTWATATTATAMEFNQCHACCGRYNWSGFPNPTFDIGWHETWIVKCQSFIFSVSMGQRAMVFGHISSLCTRGLSNCMCGTWLDSCAMVSAIHPSGPFEASTCERCVIYCNLRDFVCIFKNRCPVGLNFDTCQLLMVCQQNWGGVIVFDITDRESFNNVIHWAEEKWIFHKFVPWYRVLRLTMWLVLERTFSQVSWVFDVGRRCKGKQTRRLGDPFRCDFVKQELAVVFAGSVCDVDGQQSGFGAAACDLLWGGLSGRVNSIVADIIGSPAGKNAEECRRM